MLRDMAPGQARIGERETDGADQRVAGEYLTDVTTGPNSGTVQLVTAPNPGPAQEWDFVCGDSCGPI